MGDVWDVRAYDPIGGVGHLSVGDVAGNGCGVFALRRQGAAVEPAAGTLRLSDAAVGGDGHRLGAGLTAISGVVGLAVIEDVPLAVDTFQASVVIGRHVQPVLALPAVQAHVAVGLQDAAVYEVPIRILAGCIGEHAAVFIGVDEIIRAVDLPDAAGLIEAVALKAGSKGFKLTGQNSTGVAYDRQHVVCKHDMVRSHDVPWFGQKLLPGAMEQHLFQPQQKFP